MVHFISIVYEMGELGCQAHCCERLVYINRNQMGIPVSYILLCLPASDNAQKRCGKHLRTNHGKLYHCHLCVPTLYLVSLPYSEVVKSRT